MSATGSFIWYELMTSDATAAAKFYGAVVGWKIGAEGRKLYSGTALYTESGRLCAIGHCTWILLKA